MPRPPDAPIDVRDRRRPRRRRRTRMIGPLVAVLLAAAVEAVGLAVATPAAAADPLPLPDYDPAAVADPPGTASAGTVPIGGTAGEFSVSDTGSAAYDVPLRVVPGRGGLQPRLSLHYSSEAGDGQVGTGFSLSGLSQITRCDRTVAEDGNADGVTLGDSDRFCLDGQKLVAVSGAYGADGTEYRTRVDSHVRVRSYRAAGATGRGPTHFVVQAADGLVSDYGTDGQAVVVGAGGLLDFARIAWPIVRTADRTGNLIEYEYGTRVGTFGSELERWPVQIRYGRAGQLDRRVDFQVVTRADRRSGYLHGNPRESTKLLSSVTMSAKPGATWERARSYGLLYQTSAGSSGASLLTRVTECGRVPTECLRPTRFGWASGSAGFAGGVTQTSTGLPLVPTSYESVLTAADFSGDGRTDLAWPEAGAWRYVLAQSGGYSSPSDRPGNPAGVVATSFTLDYDLDGRVDLLPRSAQIGPYRPILTRSAQPFPAAETPFLGGFNQVTSGLQFAGGMTGDFDGDGYQDVLEYRKPGGTSSDQPVKWAWRHRTGTLSPTVDATPPSDSQAFGPQVELTALQGLTPDKVLVIDANGDGRDEIIHPTNNSAVSLDPLGRVQPFTYFSIRNALLALDVKAADVNGDGLTDLITNGDETGGKDDWLHVRINTGREFQTPLKTPVTAGNELAAVQVVDDDGDGRDDLLIPKHNATDKYYALDVVRPRVGADGLLTFPVTGTEVGFAPRGMTDLRAQGPRMADVDGDGRTDVVVVNRGGTEPGLRVFRHASGAGGTGQADLLDEVREGSQAPSSAFESLPATVAVSYAPLTASATYQPGDCPRTASLLCLTSGLRTVVREVRRDAGTGAAVRTARYTYGTGRLDKASRAFLGFSERRVTEDVAGGEHGPVTTRTFYSNTTRLDPRPLEEWAFASLPGGAQSLTRTTLDWAEKATVGGASFGHVTARRVRRYEISPGCPSCLAFWPRSQLDASGAAPYAGTLDRTPDVDQFGNVLTRSSEQFGADQSQPQGRTTVTTAFDVDAASWLVSRARLVVTTDAVPSGTGWASTTRTAESTFAPGSTLVTRTRRYDSAAAPGRVLATELGYDAAGQLVRSARVDETTGVRREATFAHDPMGYPHATRNAAGHLTRTGYDPVSGQLEVTVDANRLRTEHTFDSLGRPVRTRQPAGAETVTSYALEAAGPDLLPRTEVRSGTGAVTQVVADRLGRPVAERFEGFDGTMRQRTLRYEAEGGLAERTVPQRAGSGATPDRTTFTYDDLGRVRSSTDPAGAVRSVSHSGLDTVTTDGAGHRDRQVRDARGATVRSVDGLGTPAETARTYRYGPFGTLLRTEVEGLPAGASTFAYDAQGRVVSGTDAERGTTTVAYDAFGDVLSSRDAEGRETTQERDALGRLVRSTVTRAGVQRSVLTHQYDTAGSRSRAGMLLASTLVDRTGGSPVETGTEWVYDDLSRVSEVHHRLAGEDLAFGYTYDAFGRTTGLRYPALPGQAAGTAVAYEYGPAATTNGRLRTVHTTGSTEQLLWTATATDEQDRLSGEQSGDLAGTAVTRDEVGRVTAQVVTTAATDQRPSRLLLAESYAYDGEGNLRQRRKGREDGSDMTETFGYDPLDRVTSATLSYPDPCPGGCPERQDGAADPEPPAPGPVVSRAVDSWAYDKLGNLTASARRGTYAYDPARPTLVTEVRGGLFGDRRFRHDAVGNQVERDGQLVTYNDADLPVRVTDSRGDSTATFAYHPDGQRARRTTAAGTTTSVPGLYERVTSGAATEHRFLVPVGGRTAATLRFSQAGGTVTAQPARYVHVDRLGSTALVTEDTDAAPKAVRATVREERSYDAFGAPRDPDWRLDADGYGTELTPATVGAGFTGHDDDRELGLVDMSGRVYDPALGRFLTADPVVAGANASQAWNRYAYVSNNPLTSTDPDGHEECFGCTFWDEGGWGGGSGGGGGGGGVWGPSGPDPGHGAVDDFFQDGEAFDRGGNGAIDPTRNGSREIQRGVDRYDRDRKEAWAEADDRDAATEAQEAYARWRDAYTRELARLKALYGEAAPQVSGSQPGTAKPGSAATSPQALACNGDCPVGDGATDTPAPYEGGVCDDGGTGCVVDDQPAAPPAPAAPAAAGTPAAPPIPAPSWPIKPGDTVSVTIGPGTPFSPWAGASAGVTPSVTYNPAAWGGVNLGLALSAGAYTAAGSAGISAGYSGYIGWNVSVAVRFGPFFYSVGPEATWRPGAKPITGTSAAINGIPIVGPGFSY